MDSTIYIFCKPEKIFVFSPKKILWFLKYRIFIFIKMYFEGVRKGTNKNQGNLNTPPANIGDKMLISWDFHC